MDGPHLIVDACPGYKGEKTPRSFTLEGKTLHVQHVVDRWYSDTHSYFRVTASGVREVRATRQVLSAMWNGLPHLKGSTA